MDPGKAAASRDRGRGFLRCELLSGSVQWSLVFDSRVRRDPPPLKRKKSPMEERRRSRHGLLPGRGRDIAVAGMLIAPLLLPMGYWLAPLSLLLIALLAWRHGAAPLSPAGPLWCAAALLLGLGAAELAAGLWHGELALAWPTVLAALLAAAVGPAVCRLRPALAWWWGGLALAAIGNGLWALWQAGVEGARRANGHGEVNAILFGNLALLSGLLCLAGLGWAWQQESRRRWLVALLLGAAGGLLASALSGTRGG